MKIDLLGTEPARVIGLMSGTSADGVDAAILEVRDAGAGVEWRLLHHAFTAWNPEMRSEILGACEPDASARRIVALNVRLGELFAEAACAAARGCNLPMEEVSAIASHGQTVWHQPVPAAIGGGTAAGTLQIGEAALIAAITGRIVVSDFRAADMAVGGQGAPLVPFADHLLFGGSGETRAIQNLGGIGNVTLLPAGGTLEDVIACDTGPGNMVLDWLAERVSGGSLRCDVDGALAAAGTSNATLLEELLRNPYFAAAPPKSTGRETFGAAYCAALYERAGELGLDAPDVMATATALTVESIAMAYEAFLLPRGKIAQVIVGGGGTRNPILMSGLKERLAPIRVSTHEQYGIPDAAKEATAFALLGYCTLRGRASNVPSATGARRRSILGKVSFPPL